MQGHIDRLIAEEDGGRLTEDVREFLHRESTVDVNIGDNGRKEVRAGFIAFMRQLANNPPNLEQAPIAGSQREILRAMTSIYTQKARDLNAKAEPVVEQAIELVSQRAAKKSSGKSCCIVQ